MKKTKKTVPERSRENGKKGGRPPGALNKITKARMAAYELFIQEASKHMSKVVVALLSSAEGVKMLGKNGVYRRAPDVGAIREYLDRIMGSQVKSFDIETDNDTKVTITFTKKEQELHDRFANGQPANRSE